MYPLLAAILSLPLTLLTAHAQTGTTQPQMQPAHTPGQQIITTTQNPTVNTSITFTSPFGSATITDVLNRIINYAILVVGPLAAVMILYGAFQILTSRGEAAKVTAGKKTIIYALGGLTIVILARGLVAIFRGLIAGLGA